jgi:ABC-type bacteriocin/lantibiotic exporter with double-glycine peptidase domain
MTALLLTVVLAGGLPAGGLSTDDLDEYVRQMERAKLNCGPTCVWYCLRMLGHEADRDTLCRVADIGPTGTSLQKLVELCGRRGVTAKTITTPPNTLHTLAVPSTLVVDRGHAVVYLGTDPDGTVSFFEPADGQRKTAPREKVERNWSGEAVVFEDPAPPPAFVLSVAAVAATAVVLVGMIGLRRFR